MWVISEAVVINLWALTCIIVGLILVAVEMSIPGFGLPGIAGAILLILGIVLQANTFGEALIVAAIILAILTIMLFVVLHSAQHGRISKSRIILKDAETQQSGFSSVDRDESILNQSGVALTPLRPAGAAEIAGKRIDVVTESEFIEAGERIRVVKISGPRIVVQKETDRENPDPQ